MVQRNFFIVIVLIFLFNGEIIAQEKIVEKIPVSLNNYTDYKDFLLGQDLSSYIYRTPVKRSFNPFTRVSLVPGCGNITMEEKLIIPWSQSQPLLASDYYVKQMPFFCRKELQIEKATSIPLRFRLGSLQYTDYLEQKPNAKR